MFKGNNDDHDFCKREIKDYEFALKLIERSTSIDHETPTKWAQWCRDVASAGFYRNTDELEQLAKFIPPSVLSSIKEDFN